MRKLKKHKLFELKSEALKMNSIRAERVASLIKEEVSDIITKVLEHESVGFWTVTNVRMSPDLRYAKIYISVYGDKITQQSTIRKIESLKKDIRYRLGSRLRLRFIPEIEFYLDDTLDHVDRINALLKQIEEKEKNNKGTDGSTATDKTG